MDLEKYGTKLSGYALTGNYKGQKLSKFHRYNGENKEYKIGYIESTEKETLFDENGNKSPVNITIWTLKDGSKYHYISS